MKLGNSRSNLIIRIPTKVQAALGLEPGKTVKLKIEDAKKLGLVVAWVGFVGGGSGEIVFQKLSETVDAFLSRI